MRFISLFAGIGGIDLGLERAGMECVAQVEKDEYCTKILTKHWPNVPKHGDIRNVGKENLPAADLICGGFPCQPFSVAGKRRGTEDDRHLWPEMLRVIAELQPAWVIGENVPGIINIFLDQALSDLEDQGYTCETFVLPAVSFNAPHRRDRVFVVAYTEGVRPGGRGSQERGNGRLPLLPREQEGREMGSEAQGRGEQFSPVAYTEGNIRGTSGDERPQPSNGTGKNVPDAEIPRLEGTDATGNGRTYGRAVQQVGSDWWSVEPGIRRVADGVPNRVDRIRSLGNAVVPQVAEFIGRLIMETQV